jgi:hypothetical protein
VKHSLLDSAGLVALALVSPLVVSLGCSSSDGDPGPARGPENLGVLRVSRSDGTAFVEKSGATLPIDCDYPLIVTVAPKAASGRLGDFLLAPPDDCSSTVNCGWIALTATSESGDSVKVLSAQANIAVELAPAMRLGTLTLRVELRDSSGEPVLTNDDEVLSGEFEVVLSPDVDCSAPAGSTD